MGKRKGSVPQKADDTKRRLLTWDMKDLKRDFDLNIVGNDDPSLQQEASQAERFLADIQKNQDVLESVDSGYGSTASLAVDDGAAVQNLIAECEFHLTVYDEVERDARWTCTLGSFSLELCGSDHRPPPESLPDEHEFWLYVNSDTRKHLVYYEINSSNGFVGPGTSQEANNKQILYYEAETKVPLDLLEGLRLKCFKLVSAGYDPGARRLSINVSVTDGAMTSLRFPSEGMRPKKINKTISHLMSKFYNSSVADFSNQTFVKKHNIESLYEEVKHRHSEDDLSALKVNVQHPSLRPRLRDYQKQTVLWMLSKEKYHSLNHPGTDICPDEEEEQDKGRLHSLYTEVSSQDGQTLYYNKHGGWLVRDKPLAVVSPPGGILADEMGLGKTVEVLCCMLLHPRLNLPKLEPLPVMEDGEEAPSGEEREEEWKENGAALPTTGVDKGTESNDLVFETPKQENTSSEGSSVTATSEAADYRSESPSGAVSLQEETLGPLQGVMETDIEGSHVGNDDVDGEMGDAESAEVLPSVESVGEPVVPPGEPYVIDHTYCDKIMQMTVSGVCSERTDDNIIHVHGENSNLSGDIILSDETIFMDGINIQNEVTITDGTDAAYNNITQSDADEAKNNEPKDDTDILNIADDLTLTESTLIANSRAAETNGKAGDISQSGSKKKRRKKKKGRKTRKSVTRTNSSSTDQSVSSTASKEVKKKRSRKETFAKDAEPEEKNIFREELEPRRKKFECICGKLESTRCDALVVECCHCGLGQHATCMNYDVQDPHRGQYLCPHCHTNKSPIPSGATLIITPNSISHQWIEEIRKHIREESIKVLVYTGVHKLGFVQPQTLAQKDIVITTYETLRKEIDYVDLPHTNSDSGRRFRHPKRFMAIPSPIVAVEWWRICLDEAQMVEVTTTKTAEMALRLKAVNRWCVTGTPIQRGIDDLYGLFLFLGVEPFWVHQWWQKVLYEPFCYGHKEALHSMLHQTLWRTAKADVLDQICLPMQTEELHWLTFSPVEEHFYRRQYQECAREALQKLSKWTDSTTLLNSLDRYTLHQLLHPLVRLRQACCHPQAVRGEFLPIHKTTMTMEQLLQQLIKKVQLECEEAHRQWVFAMNGLAALDLITHQISDAVDKYRSVLRSVEEHKAEVRTDELQQLHTLHNLDEILTTRPEGVPPTLRDHQLHLQVKDIKTKYIARFTQQVAQAQDAWTPVQKSLRDVTNQYKRGRGWWVDLLQWVTYANLDQSLVEKVKDDLAENRRQDAQGMALRFRDVRGLQYVIGSHLEELQSTHEKLSTTIRKLSVEPSVGLIAQTVECCLRPAKNTLKTCPFCKADDLFQGYESKLFSFVEKGVTDQGTEGDDPSYAVSTRRQGTWADSETERALKTLLNFSKTWAGDRDCLEQGAVHMKLLEVLKKEFKCLRTMWLYLRERVSALDELNMATTRMRLRFPDEPRTDLPQANILERPELGPHRLKLDTDRIVGKNELKKKLGQLLYLRNLAKAQTPLDGGQNPSPCPICQKKLGKKWCVLLCGHCFCLECIQMMVDLYSFGRQNRSLKCPICRQRTSHAEISYVSTRGSDPSTSDNVNVKGDHSTKLEGIVSCLLKIHQEEPLAKSLVFSTWTDVLDLLETALTENNINFKSLHGSYKFQKNLECFKHSTEVQVLLLPVQSGANGLNLIEATHVLLVEPILNPAQELQAIGRVHRIGQTKPTVVHRFLVRGTIEEGMYSLLQTVQKPTNSHNAEETTLTIGELSTLFTEVPQASDGEDDDEDGDGGITTVMETRNASQHAVTMEIRERRAGNDRLREPSVAGTDIDTQPSDGAITDGNNSNNKGVDSVDVASEADAPLGQESSGADRVSLEAMNDENIVFVPAVTCEPSAIEDGHNVTIDDGHNVTIDDGHNVTIEDGHDAINDGGHNSTS